MNQYIPGTRPGTERQTPRLYSIQTVMLSPEESEDLAELQQKALEEEANCLGKSEQWVGDELPTDRDAQYLCAGCKVKKLCRDYAEKYHPAYGVWSGVVYGRDIEASEKEEEND